MKLLKKQKCKVHQAKDKEIPNLTSNKRLHEISQTTYLLNGVFFRFYNTDILH